MAEKNQETEDAFMDELREAIGTSQTVSFHLLIRRVRQSHYIGETARGYAWNIRDIIGHDENLMRRFLESVSLPRDVETILSDPSYDYKGDRGESLFWGVGGPRLITDAQRAEMRRRRLGGWIEPPPAKRITVVKKDDPKKEEDGKAGKLHQPGTSKAVQSDDRSLPSICKGGEKGGHSRNAFESPPAKRIVEKDDPKKTDEAGKVSKTVVLGSSKALKIDQQALPSSPEGGQKGGNSRHASESASAKRIAEDDSKKKDEDETDEIPQRVEPGTSKAFQALSKGEKKAENSRNTCFESVIKQDTSEDEQDLLGVEFENQTLQSFSKGKDADVNSSFSGSAQEEDNSEHDKQDLGGGSGGNRGRFYGDKRAIPSCSRDENTVDSLSVSSESVKEVDREDLSEVDSNYEERLSYSESEDSHEHSCEFCESSNEESIEDQGERETQEEISETSNDSYSEDQVVPEYEESDDCSSTSSEYGLS